MTGEKRDEAITKLQETIKARDQTIVNLKSQAEKNKTSKEQIIAEKDKQTVELKKLHDQISRLTQDKMKLDGTNSKQAKDLKNLQSEIFELRIDNKRHMAEKQGVGQGGGLTYKELEDKLQEANDENYILR